MKKKITKKSHSLNVITRITPALGAAITLVLLAVHGVYAQTGIINPVIGPELSDPEQAQTGATFAKMFVYFWNVIIVIGAIVVLVNFIQAALEWVTAGGDSSKITKARDKMLQSFIGLAILVFSFVLINFVGDLLFGDSFQLLNFTLPNPGELTTP